MEALSPLLPVTAHQISFADLDELELETPPPPPTPILVPNEKVTWLQSPMFSRGFEDCAQEAVRYLVEEEGLAVEDPIVVGLLQHLHCCFPPATSTPCDFLHQTSLPLLSNVDASSTVNHHSLGTAGADVVISKPVLYCTEGKLTKRGPCQVPEPCVLLKPVSRFDSVTVGPQAMFPSSRVGAASLPTGNSMMLGQNLDPENGPARHPTNAVLSQADLAGIVSCLHYLTPLPSCISCTSHVTDHTVSCDSNVLWTSSVSDNHSEDKMLSHGSTCVCDGMCFSGRDTVNADVSGSSTFSDSNIEGDSHISVGTLSQCRSAPAVTPAGMLTPKEIKIRSLAHEILTLLHEEALDGSCVLHDSDDASEEDSDGEMELEDMVIEIEP